MHIDQSPLMRQCLKATVAELSEEFRGVFSRETVARYVESAYEDVRDRPTVGPNFLPVIIARFARERLWAAAQSDGRVEKELPEVLFVCERNAGRSQMAAAFAHHVSNGWVGVRSAGSHPEEQIDPVVVDAMRELGVDVTREFPKPLTDDVLRAADVVVTLGCGDACPVYPGKRYRDWPVADPVGQPLELFAGSATSSTTASGTCSRHSLRRTLSLRSTDLQGTDLESRRGHHRHPRKPARVGSQP